MPNLSEAWLRAALVFLVLWFGLGGLAHFAFTDAEVRIVPPWIPWPHAAVLVSGVFELLGAAGLLPRSTRSVAAWGLFLLTIAVTPANVHMLQHADQFPRVPVWLLVARLPFQAGLLAILGWVAVRNSKARQLQVQGAPGKTAPEGAVISSIRGGR